MTLLLVIHVEKQKTIEIVKSDHNKKALTFPSLSYKVGSLDHYSFPMLPSSK